MVQISWKSGSILNTLTISLPGVFKALYNVTFVILRAISIKGSRRVGGWLSISIWESMGPPTWLKHGSVVHWIVHWTPTNKNPLKCQLSTVAMCNTVLASLSCSGLLLKWEEHRIAFLVLTWGFLSIERDDGLWIWWGKAMKLPSACICFWYIIPVSLQKRSC